jgi:hypothetical protein
VSCELGVEKSVPLEEKDVAGSTNSNDGRTRRIRRLISCFVNMIGEPGECIEVHTRCKVGRIKRKGEL